MAERPIATETGENVLSRKGGEIAERRNPQVAEDFGQFGSVQYLNRLGPQKGACRTVLDDATRLGSERCDEWAVSDTNPTVHLLTRRKRWSRQNGRDRVTDRTSKRSFAAEATSRSTYREPCPTGLTERHFNAECLERPDHVFKSSSLIGEVTRENDESLAERFGLFPTLTDTNPRVLRWWGAGNDSPSV
jgi:hypothetical protein